jgi:hypothetical protein
MKKGNKSSEIQKLDKLGEHFTMANSYSRILQNLNDIDRELYKRKTKGDKETLVDLLTEKALLQSRLKDWDKAKRPTNKKGFQEFLQEGCFQDEMRLPHTGDITFMNCILKGLRFRPSIPDIRKIKESIPNLTTGDYRIIVINGHGAIEGNVKVQTSSSIKVSRSTSRPLMINQMPNGCWYFAQAFPGSSTIMCNRVDMAQFSNMNDPRKRDEFVSRLFTEGTYHTFMSGKTHEESDTAMVGIPIMPFHNKAWDFGESEWKEKKMIMGIYDFTDPELNLQEDLTRRKDSDGFYIYHKHPESQDSSHFAPSDKLRNHLHMSGDYANKGAFHDVRKKKTMETYRAFVKKNNRKPVKGKDDIKGQFTYSLDGITQTYPLNREAANNKFKRVYRQKIFAADWAAVRRDGLGNIYDPMAKGSDGVSIRQRMIETMERKGDIELTDVLKWFDPNAPSAVDRRKVIFIDWSCQPISLRVSVNGSNYNSFPDIDRSPADYKKDEPTTDLIALQACRDGFERMARYLNLIFSRVQSRFIEKNTGRTSIIRQAELPPSNLNRPQLPSQSPFTAKIQTDPVYAAGVGALAGPSVRAAMDIDKKNSTLVGGKKSRKKKTRRRRRRQRRKGRRKTKRK